MTNTFQNSLGALFSATGPMAPTVDFDSNLPLITRIEIPGVQMIVRHSGNTVTRLEFKCSISGDDASHRFSGPIH